MKRWSSLLLLLVVTVTTSLPGKSEAQAIAPGCFQVAGIVDCIHPLFLNYWNQQDGLHNFGYPIRPLQTCWLADAPTNQTPNKNRQLQWFERHRLEWHPLIPSVLLGRLGHNIINRVDPPVVQQQGCKYWGETGHNGCGGFANEWGNTGLEFESPSWDRSDNESLALNGLPLTEQHNESFEHPVGSNTFINLEVQWFERARYEYQPNGTVTRGLLGKQLLRTFVCSTQPTLVAREESALREVAAQQQIDFNDLAEDQLALYGSIGDSLGIIAIPPTSSLPVGADTLANSLQPLVGRVVGGLIVLDNSLPGVDPGPYIVSVDRDNGMFSLLGAEKKVPFARTVVRGLAVPLRQPKALISSSAICFAWDTTQICGQIDLPVKGVSDIRTAAESLGLNAGEIDLGQTIALLAGEDEQLECARGFAAETPDYKRCVSTVLAAPAISDEAMKRPLGDAAIGLGIVLVTRPIREEVYKEATRETLLYDLPTGAYQVFEFPTPEDQVLIDGVRATWVALFNDQGIFYMPAVAGGQLLGNLLTPSAGVSQPEAAVTTSLILRNRCFFAAPQCPWLELP